MLRRLLKLVLVDCGSELEKLQVDINKQMKTRGKNGKGKLLQKQLTVKRPLGEQKTALLEMVLFVLTLFLLDVVTCCYLSVSLTINYLFLLELPVDSS